MAFTASITYAAGGAPANPLTINFVGGGSSIPNPPLLTYAWNFGDGSSVQTVNTPNISYSYAAPGIYLITLVITDSNNNSATCILYAYIDGNVTINLTIAAMAAAKLPSAWAPSITPFQQKWMLYLQPQVPLTPSAPLPPNVSANPGIPGNQVYDEKVWPDIWRLFIADLIVYDVIVAQMTQFALDGNTDPSANGLGSQKTLKVGPADAEWWQDTYTNLEYQTMYANAVWGKNGILNQFKEYLCIMSSRLGATLPFCTPHKYNMLFKKMGRHRVNPNLLARWPAWVTFSEI